MYSWMITRRMMSREREAPRMRTGKSREIIARDSRRTRPVFGQSHICSSPQLSIMISVRSSEEKEICALGWPLINPTCVSGFLL